MCNKSDSIVNIAKALVAFSADVKPIDKDGTNPHFKSEYATLDNIIDETKPLLQKHGLTVMQFPGGDGERITVRTMILHSSGEWIESEPLTLKAVKTDPQGAGSAITYGRRYSYAAALSLSLGDDDDGNAASTPPKTFQTTQTRQAPNIQTSDNDDLAAIARASDEIRNGTSQPVGGGAAARVYKLREQLNMTWPDLNNFAGNVLGREIKFLKTHVKTEDEWKQIEEALKVAV